jgi:hypothetical protein
MDEEDQLDFENDSDLDDIISLGHPVEDAAPVSSADPPSKLVSEERQSSAAEVDTDATASRSHRASYGKDDGRDEKAVAVQHRPQNNRRGVSRLLQIFCLPR